MGKQQHIDDPWLGVNMLHLESGLAVCGYTAKNAAKPLFSARQWHTHSLLLIGRAVVR